jgi:hypothetical protein
VTAPSKLVRDTIRARLAAAYELTLGEVCLEMAIARPQAIVFEFDRKSPNFFQGQLDPDDIEGTTTKSYPIAVLWTQAAVNESREKFHLFSGDVTAFLDIYLSWRPAAALRDYETLGDAVEATLFRVFHDPDWVESYHGAIAYTGDLSVVRGPVQTAGEHWRQQIRTRLKVQVDQ